MTKEPEVRVEYGTLDSVETMPTILGTIYNKSLQNIQNVELDVFALDNKENVVAASRTFVDNLKKNSSQDFVFTWQKPFDTQVSVINITYWINP